MNGWPLRNQIVCVRGWYRINRRVTEWNLSRRAALRDAVGLWRWQRRWHREEMQ